MTVARSLRFLIAGIAITALCGCGLISTNKGSTGSLSTNPSGVGEDGGDLVLGASDARPDMVIPSGAGHQSKSIYTNDAVVGEAVKITTSSGGPYVARHGFFITVAHNLPTGTN